MYESVPYERWRYHVYVELMRGARGWQVAHGPGDPSVFRGLQAEVRHLHPFIYSYEKTPAISISPQLENMVRQKGDKTLLIAASTHGLTFGNYRQSPEKSPLESRALLLTRIFFGMNQMDIMPRVANHLRFLGFLMGFNILSILKMGQR